MSRHITTSPYLGFPRRPKGMKPLGDLVSGSQSLYGFHKLRSGYTGNCLKVERSSDGTTQDIGFAADGSMDADALTSFVGGGTARLHTWYDQGEGSTTYDLTQTTDSLQPIITTDTDGHYYAAMTGGDYVSNNSFMGEPTNSTTMIIAGITSLPGLQPFANFGAALGGALSLYWTVEQSATVFSQGSTASWAYSRRQIDVFEPYMIGYKNLDGTQQLFDMGSAASETNSQVQLDFDRIEIGRSDYGAVSNGRVYCVAVWPSDADLDQASKWAKSRYSSMYSYSDFYMNIGDSITSAAFCGIDQAWPRASYSSASIDRYVTLAKGGWRIQDWIDNKSTIEWYLKNLNISGTKTALVFLGTNDIFLDGLTGAQCYTKLKEFYDDLIAMGFDQVVPFTQLPRISSSIDAERAAFNTSIKGDSDFADVVELDGVANLTNATNTTYFTGDQTHLTAAGQALVETQVAGVLSGL